MAYSVYCYHIHLVLCADVIEQVCYMLFIQMIVTDFIITYYTGFH